MMYRLLVLLFCLGGVAEAEAAPLPVHCAAMVEGIGIPEIKLGHEANQTLCRQGYVLAHDNAYKTPVWVVERLVPSRFQGPGDREEQGNPFKADPELLRGARAELEDYKAALPNGRKFDRGHMAPAASMKFSKVAMAESFYLSNMAPQQGAGLNQQIWRDLEDIVRNWTCERGELYVVTGPIYEKTPPEALGPDGVAVPTAFFKLAYDPTVQRAIAFILPNESVAKQGRPAWTVLKDYIVTLRTVEERSGLDFLGGIPARERRRLATLKSVMWPVREQCQ